MPISFAQETQVTQEHISPYTSMGANLTSDGATFRVWAPRAQQIFLKFNANADYWTPKPDLLLTKDQQGYWSGFVRGAKDGDTYRFYVVGNGSEGFKRDPYARELVRTGYPKCDCIIRDPNSYPWHVQNFKTPSFNDLILYQLHVGTFYGVDKHSGVDNREHRVATFLDVIDRVEYLAELGVNAIQLLPIDEFPTDFSLGYNGFDIYSPEMDYTVPPEELIPYLERVNTLLTNKNQPIMVFDQLVPQINQLKALVDIFHLYGIAVLFDVVYNHAGGDFDDESLYFFDRMKNNGNNNNDSLYFTDQGWAGGLVYAYWKEEVRQFLIDNAKFFIEEYHVDGFRFDEVTVIDSHGGWHFCQDLTNTLKFIKPNAIKIAEYWNAQRWWALWSPQDNGAGFDAVWHDGARDSIRSVIDQAAKGRESFVNLDRIRNEALFRPDQFPAAWQSIQFLENHDLLLANHDDKQPRIVALADPGDHRSWYARSRTRVANGLLLCLPGIPLFFSGQEFIDDHFWSDNPRFFRNTLTWWDGLKSDKVMIDHLRFIRELVAIRRRQPALRAEAVNVFHIHNDNRVIAFHRWIENFGRDVIVVVSLNEFTFWNYRIGFPVPGRWLEIFNSDVYDNWVNPNIAGNAGAIWVNEGAFHDMPHSAEIVIPANSLLVFARDFGD